MDRTVVHRGGKTTATRYSADDAPKPAPHARKQYWHPGSGRYQRNPYYRPDA